MNSTDTIRMWISNDYWLYSAACEIALSREYHLNIDRDDALKTMIEDFIPENLMGALSDLLNHALSDVDWSMLINELIEEGCEVA